jgi:predicted RNase H-like HicB family nuclease
MLSEYIAAAMKKARYEIIQDAHPYHGEIPPCKGIWASGGTLEECRANLQETLEGWLVVSLRRGLPIPALDGVAVADPEPTSVHG